MRLTRNIVVLMTVLTLTCTAARAQTPAAGKLTVDVNVGAQTQSRTVDNSFSIPIYGQTATVNTTATVDAGPLFDMSVGYKFMPKVGAAVGFSTFSRTGTATGAASVPSPIFFNRPLAVTLDATDAKRTDRNVYVLLVGYFPVAEKVDLALSIGPSFTQVKQTMITSVTIPAGTQTVVPTVQSQSGTAKGVNVGADLSYLFTRQVGAGLFLRYNGGSVDLDSASDVKAGGFQIGVGLRLRF